MNLEKQIAQTIAGAAPGLEILPAVAIIHHLQKQTVEHMNSWGLKNLQVSMEELKQMGKDYHYRFFNQEESKEYVPKILGLLERNNNDEKVSYFQQVRANPQSEWQLWLSCTRIFMRDKDDLPLLTLTVTVPVEKEHNFSEKVERLLEENNFLRKNNHLFVSLSKRERGILKLMAQDKPSAVIASELNLSEHTVKTHRRNIKQKLKTDNLYDIVRFAQAFNLL